ncbi:MAG: Ig domain-containing protein, partial [Planctomycetota bacterium]
TPTTAETANFTVEVTDSQGTPDTDTQALSITISDMGAVTYEFAESESMESNNTETWQDKVVLNFNSTEADDWLILAFADNRGDYYGGKANVQLLVDGGQEGEMLRRPHHSTWFPYTVMKVANLDAGSHTINMQYRQVGDPEQDVYIQRARVVAIKKDDLEIATASAEGSQILPTTPTDILTLNWTPATAGDYLLVFFNEFQAGWTDDLYIDTVHNSTTLDSSVDETRSDSDWGTWMSVSVVSCDTSEQTAKITAYGSATDSMMRRVRIAAVRLTGSPLAGYHSASDDTPSSTTSTTYQEKLTTSWDAGAEAGNWLLLTTAQLNQDPTSRQCRARVQLNDTSTLCEQNRVPIYFTSWVDFACMAVESLSSTNQVDVDYCSNNTDSTTTIDNVHFVALPLDAAGGPAPLDITTTSLADGQIDVAYSETLAATGGVTPYSWAVVSGSLPAGLSLNGSTGEISGTPTTGGTSNFTVEVTDSDAPPSTDQQALSIYVPDDLVVTTSSLPNGTVGIGYSQTVAATGGVTPYSWSVVAGALPGGLSLNSSTGEISGTPTTEEVANFTVRATDSNTPADTDDQGLSITIEAGVLPLNITTASLPDGQIGVGYSETMAATGGVTPYSWSIVAGALPAGLSLNSSTGEISGTPTTGGTSNFTVEVTDSDAPPSTDQQALSIYIPDDLVV